jgi:hypothetical protein
VNVPGDERVQDEPRTPAPRKPIEDVLADAEREFAADLGTGTVPGIRAIRGTLNVGQSRAEKVQAHLSGLVESVPAPELADPDASAEEAMRHAADAIRARRIRGPEDHVVLTDKSSGEEMVRWVGNGADTDGFLYVSDSAIKLGYDTDYFASEVYE